MIVDSFTFFPSRDVPDPPPGVEERRFTTADGVRLHAWYAPPRPEAPVLVWSHGNGGNIADRTAPILELRERGCGILAYDYRGYGRSNGRPTESGVYLDSQAAFDSEVAAGTAPSRIVCFGESLGGAVSIRLARQRPCAAVAVVSTFPRLRNVAQVHYGPLAALAGDRFDSASVVARLGVPLFVAHGDLDEIVPFRLGEELFAAAREPKRFLRLRGFHHNDVFESSELLDAVASFAREAVRPAEPPPTGS
jgi:fermentation-respiration switch protein FrsA (DUF1100 family)